MTATHWLLAMILPAYLLGSIPFGLLVGLAKGVDPRKAGSGNIGATNVGRLLGGKFFALVFALDLLKSMIPCLIAGAMVRFNPIDRAGYLLWIGVGFAAVLGHMFSLFLGFRGGKGVATSTGVILGIWPYFTFPAILSILTFLVVFKLTRYVSLGSIVGSTGFALMYIVIGLMLRWPLAGAQLPLLIAAILLACLIVYKHRGNIARLRAGTENRAGRRQTADVVETAPAVSDG